MSSQRCQAIPQPRLAQGHELTWINQLLVEQGLLPIPADRPETELAVLYRHAELIGVGAWERHGNAALLRSIAIVRAHRQQGHASRLCAFVEARAGLAGIRELYLLTETAADFFARRGFRVIDRASAAPAIRASEQFARQCPDSATLMYRQT